ncbi:type VI secretion protein [Paraburkholderia silvatlantica]|uniref:Type VI secretion system protein n=1 Tax=Paraburkholderia silvatlantica TaxID=321895 RepID=A0ABR6FF90_9BURK|nr:type VI secretion protein [Paraburkholderia silvatlantica]MBB2925772.1 type VI secretion system protein [Paraburkholderia silvatlantica]
MITTLFAGASRAAKPYGWRAATLAFALAQGLSACSSLPKVQVDTLAIAVSTQANQDTPIAVDAVLVRNRQLLDALLGLPSAKWFAQRDQWRRDHPEDIAVVSFEVVPGQQIAAAPFPFGGKRGAGVVVFADYQTPGAHRVRLDRGPAHALLLLGDQDLSVQAAH